MAALVIFLFLAFSLSGQTEITVLDENGDALPGAHVTYTSIQTGKGKTMLTDISGKAVIPSEFTKDSDGIGNCTATLPLPVSGISSTRTKAAGII